MNYLLERIPFMIPFINVQRTEPCSNKYILRIYVKLKGYTAAFYSPEKFTYERVGGVNFRNTEFYIKPADPEHMEEFYEDYTIIVNRKEEDAIYIGLVSLEDLPTKEIPKDKSEFKKIQTRSFALMSVETEGEEKPPKKHGGGTGTYEP
jgi:hypothetical protein